MFGSISGPYLPAEAFIYEAVFPLSVYQIMGFYGTPTSTRVAPAGLGHLPKVLTTGRSPTKWSLPAFISKTAVLGDRSARECRFRL